MISPLTFPEAIFLILFLVLVIYPPNLSSVQSSLWVGIPAPGLTYWLSDFGQVT